MNQYFHAWNLVFDGLPKPFWGVYKKFPDLKYAWENIRIKDLRELHIKDLYIKKFISLRKSDSVFKNYKDLIKENIKILNIRDTDYPSILRSLNNHLPPLVLYIKGDLKYFKKQSLSIVGTRQMTGYGESITRQTVKKLSHLDLVITSGMAQGIDLTAHQAAVENDMPTIAVLGYGIKKIPFYMTNFTEKIIKKGMIISEYPPGLEAQKYHFPLRNRIISGLSKATLVVEAGIKSGARITAQYALDQSRDVYAVPGNIHNEKSMGTNLLIQQAAAHPLLEAVDLLDSYTFLKEKEEFINNYPENHKKIIDMLQKNHYSAHDLLRKGTLSTQQLNFALTELELEGKVRKSRDGKYYLT